MLPVEEYQRICPVEVKNSETGRVAIFSSNWMEVSSLADHLPDKHMKSWRKGQMVSVDCDIERLKSLNAPIKVYIEDGSN